jgi:peptide subunit release factor 1 (eRF1)
MIKRDTIQNLMHRAPSERPVMSLYLDMSVNAENKRTYHVFLQQQRAQYAELDSDRPGHHREPLGAALEQATNWIDENFDQSNRGIALFADVGGNDLEVLQLPVALPNRLVLSDRPVIAPLAQMLASHRHYGIALVDREHCRLAGYYLGELTHHKEITPDAYPTPHDVHKGGYAAKDYQKFKAEETRQFFKQFASEMSELDRRHNFDHWILLGTVENVRNFSEFVSAAINDRVIHTGHSPVSASDTDIIERLTPFFAEQSLHDEAATVDLVRDRLRTNHLAASGVRDTLIQLQEGKVDTLVLARDLSKPGAQCTRCSFYLDKRDGTCPYCGGEVRSGVDLAESMIRMAAEQEVDLEFVDPAPLSDVGGVAALLKFS